MNKWLEHFEEMYLNKDGLKVDGNLVNAWTPIYEN